MAVHSIRLFLEVAVQATNASSQLLEVLSLQVQLKVEVASTSAKDLLVQVHKLQLLHPPLMIRKPHLTQDQDKEELSSSTSVDHLLSAQLDQP